MMEFLADNWAIFAAFAFAAIVVILVVVYVKDKKQIINKMLYALVTEAEKKFGAKTGTLKFSYVMEKIYEVLPAPIKTFVPYDTLERWIEVALANAKRNWSEEASIMAYTKQ